MQQVIIFILYFIFFSLAAFALIGSSISMYYDIKSNGTSTWGQYSVKENTVDSTIIINEEDKTVIINYANGIMYIRESDGTERDPTEEEILKYYNYDKFTN